MAPKSKEAFPTDPEQWIYNRAEQIEKSLSKKQRWFIGKTYLDPEAAKLAVEIHCLEKAISAFNNLYTKFKENQK